MTDAKHDPLAGVYGTWKLVHGQSKDPNGAPLPPPYGGEKAIGNVVLTRDGRMAAVLIDGRAELPAGEKREYTSYCGAFTFDGQTLITSVDACSDPARMDTDQIRKVRFEDGLMILQPPPKDVNGVTYHRELSWRKIADG
jgi:hypothetical protein